MLKPLPASAVTGHEWVPQAIIERPLSHFAKAWEIPVTKGRDDLVEFEAAVVQIDNDIVFELVHHAGYPSNTTTICLPYEITNVAQISDLIQFIAKALDIPKQWIVWQRADNPDL